MAFKFNPTTGKLDTVADPGGADTQIQFNDGGAFGGDAGLVFNKSTNKLTAGGDVELNDGGTFTTTLQTVTPTAARTISFPNATGTVGLVAGSSGQLLYNASGANAGASTLTYDGSILTTSGRFINSYNATASSPAKAFTGTWFTGGTSTTTKPQVVIEPTGTTSTSWSTSGTGLGVNAASGFVGRLIDLQLNGTSNFNVDSTGRASVPLGTAALPSIYPGADTNTGIFSPGADQVAISTNGTGRLFIDASGNVGVGTTSTAGFGRGVSVNGTTYSYYDLYADGVIYGRVRAFLNEMALLSQGASSYLTLGTNNTERMRITSAGLLGLGTSSPTERLEVTGNLKLSSIGTGNTASSYDLLFFGTTSAGTQTDQAKIHSSTWTTNSNGGNLQFYTSNASNAITERMRIDGAGNVGIGTTSPATTLDVNGDVTITDKIIHGGDTDTAIRFPAADTVSVETAGSERARIDSSGRLLVGTSTSRNVGSTVGRIVQIEGTSATTTGLTITRNSADATGTVITLGKSRSASNGGSTVLLANDSVGALQFAGADGTDLETVAASISCDVDGTPGANDMPGRLVFSTTADGAASPTERLRITSAGVLQVADAGNITVGTTTGTKIGTATTQKIGFYNATPVVQPAAVADATTAVDVITQLNDLLAKLRTLGIIAT